MAKIVVYPGVTDQSTHTPLDAGIRFPGRQDIWCGYRDSNSNGCPPEPKSGASANSTTPA